MMLALLAVLVSAQVTAEAPRVAAASESPQEPLEVVLYSDFQCPYCAQFAQPFRELQSKGIDGADTKVTFKHFPMSIHPAAQLGHQASIAAKEQGKFWEMHDLLFANPRSVQRADLRSSRNRNRSR